MSQILQKIPFLIELVFNGCFIILYSLKNTGRITTNDFPAIDILLDIGMWFVPFVLFLSVVANYLSLSNFEEFLRKHTFSLIVFVPILITWGDVELTFWLSLVHLLSSTLALYEGGPEVIEKSKVARPTLIKKFKLRSAQMVTLSFVGMILVGTFLLMLPLSSKNGESISFIDALFTATSATCVTGLSTLSLVDRFSLSGQMIVLFLIQVGGLGIMTLGSSVSILLGKSMSMKDRVVMRDLLDVSSLEELLAMIIDIIKYTFFIELWGAIVLTVAFTAEGFELGNAIYYGFFHSISAFCNAGFSLFNNSLENYATNPLINGTVGVLITLGGLGFIVLKELKEVVIKGKSFARIALHSKVVLITSFFLTISGALFIFFGEFLYALDSYSLIDKVQISLFQSVTLRTAGFNTIPLASLNKYTLYAMTIFMFIGASPGSTGGGIKTTTLAILIQSIKSTLTGRKNVGLFRRSISAPMVVRATALTFISIVLTSIFILIVMKLEPDQSFLTLFFEAVSASGTVGLSLGITPFLSALGKFGISLLMLIGRIGPLTLVLAIGERDKSIGKVEYPNGRIMIG